MPIAKPVYVGSRVTVDIYFVANPVLLTTAVTAGATTLSVYPPALDYVTNDTLHISMGNDALYTTATLASLSLDKLTLTLSAPILRSQPKGYLNDRAGVVHRGVVTTAGSLLIRKPDGTETTIVQANLVTTSTVGLYQYSLTLDQIGIWAFIPSSTGNIQTVGVTVVSVLPLPLASAN